MTVDEIQTRGGVLRIARVDDVHIEIDDNQFCAARAQIMLTDEQVKALIGLLSKAIQVKLPA